MAVWTDKFINVNGWARSGKRLTAVRKIVMHYTANNGATAMNHFNYFNNLKDRYASAHFMVDKIEALCIIPLNEMTYHANDVQKKNADGSAWRGVPALLPNANELSIGIEMCLEKDGTIHSETIRRAEDVAVELCKRYGLNPLTDIVRHRDVTYKNCPAPWVANPSAFEAFKNAVNAKKGGTTTPSFTKPPLANGAYPVGSIGKVTILAEALNVRNNYTTDGSTILGQVHKGETYFSYKEVGGWHLLGNGQWISVQDGKYASFEVKPAQPEHMYRVRKTWADAQSQIGAYGNLDSAKALADQHKGEGYLVFDENGTMVYDPTPTPVAPQNLYRVRLTWEDAKSQLGAYSNLDSAKALVDANPTHKVFDETGKVVYEIVKPTPAPVEQLYRVRKSWDDIKSQIGAYKTLDSAKELADKNEGYKVFDEAGKVVYEPVVKQPEPTPAPVEPTPPPVVEEPKPEVPVTPPVTPEPTPEPEPIPVDPHLGHHDIVGESVVEAEKMVAFVKERFAYATDIEEIAKQFIEVGKIYGIRGDVAFCQSIIETGWFKFDGGTAVTPDQHNYCGLGVTSKGMKGNSFETVKDGVTAQIQHLYAYATTKGVPVGETLLDPRFKYVTRGIAPHWEDLSNRWAMNANYGTHIVSLYEQLVNFVPPVVEEPVQPEPQPETPEQPPVIEEPKLPEVTEEEKAISIGKKIVDYLIEQLKKIFKL